MQTIITEADLRYAIVALESRQAEESFLLKEQFLVTVESIKPVNLIRNIFREAAESHDLQDNIINTTIGISTGYLSKLVFQGISGSPVKKILGTVIMFGIKNLVAQNPEIVKSWGKTAFHFIKNLLGDKKTETYEKKPSEAASL